MSFSFGKVHTSQPPKKITKSINCLIVDNYNKDYPCLNVLVTYKPSNVHLLLLREDLKAAKIHSYKIISTSNIEKQKADLNAEALLTVESNWYDLVENYTGKDYPVVLAIGQALYTTCRSTDISAYDFLDDNKDCHRIVLSKDFVRKDAIVYPSYDFKDIYPIIDCPDDFVNWRTRYLRSQLHKFNTDDMDMASIVDMTPYTIKLVEKEDIQKTLASLVNSDILACDTETSSLNKAKIDLKVGLIQFCNDGKTGLVIDASEIKSQRLIRLLLQVFTSAKKLVFHNAKYDIQCIWRYFNIPYSFGSILNGNNLEDTMVMMHSIHTERPQGLKPGAFYYTYFGSYDNELDKAKKHLKIESYLDIPKRILQKYAGLDPIVTYRLYIATTKQAKKIAKNFPNKKDPTWDILRWYKDIYMPMVKTAIECEYEGVYIDPIELKLAEIDAVKTIDQYKKTIAKIWNEEYGANITSDFDFGSSKQLGELLHKMNWPVLKTEKGQDSTGQENFADWIRLGYKGVDELQKMRAVSVALNSFILNWKERAVWHNANGELSEKGPVYTIKDGERELTGYSNDYINVVRNNTKIKIMFRDLIETDELVC